MSDPKDLIEVAHHMIRQHGDKAAELMDGRAQEHRDAGEHEGAIFWSGVAQAIRSIQGRR